MALFLCYSLPESRYFILMDGEDFMLFFIYARKSKQTEKGESVENQITMCRDYVERHFNESVSEENIFIDYGISAKNTDRKEFQNMMSAIIKYKPNGLVCYRLDRLSRNVRDLANLVEELEKTDTKFISIKEQFDTTTPMGRAMLMTAGVFSQLERETAAERIRDNMLMLSEDGRWLGGVTPLGYQSAQIEYEYRGTVHKQYMLAEVLDEKETVLLLYRKMIELKSLSQIEVFCMQNDIRSREGVFISLSAARNILKNPIYCVADQSIFDYFTKKGCYIPDNMANKFTGEYGIMAYNRTDQTDTITKVRPYDEWIISVGQHAAIIDSDLWLDVQNILEENSNKRFRKPKSDNAVLTGILRCGKCGGYMRSKAGRETSDGVQRYYYLCTTKEKSRKHLCDICNANGNFVDELVINEIKKLAMDNDYFMELLASKKSRLLDNEKAAFKEIEECNKRLNEIESESKNVTNAIRIAPEAAMQALLDDLSNLGKEREALENKILRLNQIESEKESNKQSLSILKQALSSFAYNIDSLSVADKRSLIKTIVSEIIWDGDNVNISLFGNMLPQSAHSKCNMLIAETLSQTVYIPKFEKVDTSTVGGRIRYYRLQKNLLQKDLANKCGYDRTTILRYERNDKQHTLESVNRIASALQIEPELLYDDYLKFLTNCAESIFTARKKMKLSRIEFAKLLGVNKHSIFRWEKGQAYPFISNWYKIKKYL